jgi:hypothetical protein
MRPPDVLSGRSGHPASFGPVKINEHGVVCHRKSNSVPSIAVENVTF